MEKIVRIGALTALAVACFLVREPPARAATESLTIAAAKQPPEVNGNASGSSWVSAAHAHFDYDLTYRRADPDDATDVAVSMDAHDLYVAFVAHQSEPIAATQHTDGVGEGIDDEVSVDLWPGGANGFHYTFSSNPIGTHYQSSSENSAFAPEWTSAGRLIPGGYEVTMRIPRSLLHAGGTHAWIVQFSRSVVRSRSEFVWSNTSSMMYPDQVQFAGHLNGIDAIGGNVASRPPARLQIYGLGEAAAASAGGSTSRIGADFSVPVTDSTAVFGTIHPDYSEVELDQQTIAPTEFRRRYSEVRPFFTQGSEFFQGQGGGFGNALLYTPGIPTPRDGLAVEGTQGEYQFAAFNASGVNRADNAEVATFTTPNRRIVVSEQRVQASMPGFVDTAQLGSLTYDNRSNFDLFATYGTDRGTNVPDPSLANDESVGGDVYGPHGDLNLTWSSQGLYFNPFDGYVQTTDVRGWSVNDDRSWSFSPSDRLQGVHAFVNVDRYRNHLGQMDQEDNDAGLHFKFRGNLGVDLSTGSSYLYVDGFGLVPYNQNGIGLSYKHDPATPSSISYNVGHYYDGYLRTLDVQTAVRVQRLGVLSFERYQTAYASPSQRLFQSLDRVSFAYQLSRRASFSAGWRFIRGAAPVQAGPTFERAGNVSLAYTQKMRDDILYVVYGDPNQLQTVNSLIVKLVHYIGAGPGA